MAFRPTEFTVRDILLDELKKRHVRTAMEASFSIPEGRKPPDGILENGSTYVLETKLGGEADYFEDIKRLTEWIKLRHAPIRGAFAVLFPGKLRQTSLSSLESAARSPKTRYEVAALFRDERPGDRREGTLSEVVDWISEQVLRPPLEIEPDTGFVVRVLAGAVDDLSSQMRDLRADQFVDIFGGRPVFDNILEVKADRLPLESLRKAAAYLLINQLIFYHVLARADPDKYPRVDAERLRMPSDLTGYFRRVLEIDYAPTFGFDVASRLPQTTTETVRSILEVVQLMGLARLRQDILGKIFHNLIPLAIRKPIAAYYTNKQAADLLAGLAVRSSHDCVIDPACGSGTLLVASYQRKKKLLEGEGEPFSERDHEDFLGREITGVDIMPFAAHLAVVHLSLQAPTFITQRVRIAVWDSTELRPGDRIPAITRELARAFQRPTLDMFQSGHPNANAEYVTKGSFTVGGFGGDEIGLDPVDVVIMNPPFTSSDRLGAEYKHVLKQRFGQEYQEYLHGKVSFQIHFLLLADRFLKPGGRLAAVLPQTTLSAETFEPIIRMLTEKYSVQAIVVGLGRSAYSENTLISEILLVAEKTSAPPKHRFALVGTKTSPGKWTYGDVNSLLSRIKAGKDGEDELAIIRWIRQRDLSSTEGGLTKLLPKLLAPDQVLLDRMKHIFDSNLMIRYRDFETETGAKAFYSPLGNKEAEGAAGRGGVYFGTSALNVIRDPKRALKRWDRLFLEEETAESISAKDRISGSQYSIPKAKLAPAVRRLSYYPRLDISGATDFTVSRYYPGLDEVMRGIYGERKGEEFLARVRDRWADRVREGASLLFLARRINVGAPGTSHLAVYTHVPSFVGGSIWGFGGLGQADAKILCLWFNSTLFLLLMSDFRKQIGGTWWVLDKHRFAQTKIPNLPALSPSQRDLLLTLFEKIRTLSFPSLVEQLRTSFSGRRQLDAAWLTVLGVAEDEQQDLLARLHASLYGSLRSLLEAMETG